MKKIEKKVSVRQLKYGNGQHELICQMLGVSPKFDAAFGETAHEAVCRLIDKLNAIKVELGNLGAHTQYKIKEMQAIDN